MPTEADDRFDRVKQIVADTSPDALTTALGSYPGGYDALLDAVFQNFHDRFRPERVHDGGAEFEFHVDTPDGQKTYSIIVTDERCETRRGAAPQPTSTVTVGVDNFVRMAVGKANGARLLVTRKIKVSGVKAALLHIPQWFPNS
jgi:putative sterol carrier protein